MQDMKIKPCEESLRLERSLKHDQMRRISCLGATAQPIPSEPLRNMRVNR